jgi:hypothetical protein
MQRTTQNKQYIEQHKNTKITEKYKNNTKIQRTTQKYKEQHKEYIQQHKN